MKRLLLLSIILLTACGPSPEEKKNIAAVTCSIMSETGNMDGAVRVREMNDAREKLGGEPFLDGDEAIQESFEFGLCQELVLDDSYKEILQPLKDAKRERERLAEEKRAEEARIAAEKVRIILAKLEEEERIAAEKQRIAAEKRAEEKRIAAEKQRIADSKPTEEKEFYSNGKLKSRVNYQPKSVGGKKHGLYEWFRETGEISRKFLYKNGELHGPQSQYHKNGQVFMAYTYKDGKKEGLSEWFHDDGKIWITGNWKDGEREGLHVTYRENGTLQFKDFYKDGNREGVQETYEENGRVSKNCYKNGYYRRDMSYCEK